MSLKNSSDTIGNRTRVSKHGLGKKKVADGTHESRSEWNDQLKFSRTHI
jgi:hypothetical protein